MKNWVSEQLPAQDYTANNAGLRYPCWRTFQGNRTASYVRDKDLEL